MNYLITGAAGFLGAALANQLGREGHNVRGIDDLSSGNPDALHEDVHFTRGDVNDRPKLWTLLQDVDCVYHLAARVLVSESILYPREYNAVNVGGTVSLMEAMRDVGVRRVVFISSGSVYGNQEDQPLTEDAVPVPRSPYAVSKLAAEYYVRTIGSLWGIETVSLRVFNAFGPGQHLPPSHPPVIPNFLKQAVRGGSLVLHGDGRQTRDFVYIDDVVRAMVGASTAPDIDQMVINVGSGYETRMRDLARLVLEITDSKAEMIYTPRNDAGVSRMCADLSIAGDKLGYMPRISLEEGLNLTLEADTRLQAVTDKPTG
ncbi:MAG: NAD-dependent epimerase/dehydratase family protein [Chloroflexi bacterium]|nr:MAG: NAD-dependent epimerase/dehydratase family protein [Chloroflexota bacterium]MBL1194551.1 NAD-dependent epimerase/dehydratase family protein [Chloroflexota bacterium]NOH11839.1 NAD-dependent epimerase/dehydratase family protein [Chloroflexota bacterium]